MFYSAQVFSKTINLKTYNTINVLGPISSNSTKKIKEKLTKLDHFRGKRNYPLYLVIDSPGGSIYAGNQLIDVIKSIKNVKTVTYFAASMASAIVEQTPGTRYIVPSGIMMFHRASGGFQGQFNDGELESQLRLWKAIVTSMEIANAKRIGISLKEYKRKVKDEYWTTAAESVKENVSDEVVLVKCSQKLVKATTTITKRTMFGTSSIEVSKCPTLR